MADELTHSPVGEHDKSAALIRRSNSILVPMMDSEDALRRKSASGHKLKEISLPEGIGIDEFRDVIAGAYMAYIGGPTGNQATKGAGLAPKPDQIKKYINLPLARIQVICATKEYRLACEARGIAFDDRVGLTQRQDYALQIILDPTAGAGLAQRLRKAGVKMSEYRAWLRNPVVKGYIDNVGGGILKELEHDMLVSLAGRAAEGDVQAIKFGFEVSGKHDPNRRQMMDMQVMMAQIIEIIKTHVRDPQALQAIGNEMLLLSSAAGISDAQPAHKELERG